MATTTNKPAATTQAAEPAAVTDDVPAAEPAAGTDDVTALREENERLRQKLASAGVSADDPSKPQEPSFGISEGTRDELERNGKASSPFTGRVLTKDDLPKAGSK